MLLKIKNYFFQIYHNRLTNLNIIKNIKIKKCTPSFHGTLVTCYIKFRIVAFFFLSKYNYISIMSILLKLEF